jgi:hypothetical protein
MTQKPCGSLKLSEPPFFLFKTLWLSFYLSTDLVVSDILNH